MNFHDTIRAETGWRLHGDETLFACAHLEVHRLTLTSPGRPEPFTWTLAHRKAAVVIAPLTRDGQLVLVRQERAPIRATIWEFPAGQIDHASDHDAAAIRATGLRELREEAGYELGDGGEVVPLGLFFSSAGFTDEHAHLLLARGVVAHPQGHAHDEHERICECRAFAPAELSAMIARGEIRDANTLAAYARLVAMGLLPG